MNDGWESDHQVSHQTLKDPVSTVLNTSTITKQTFNNSLEQNKTIKTNFFLCYHLKQKKKKKKKKN